jgi:hypothetical protein
MKIIRFVLKTLKEAHSGETHLGVAILLAGVFVTSSVDAKPISPASAKAVTEGGSPQPNTPQSRRCQFHAEAGEVFAAVQGETVFHEKSHGIIGYLKLVSSTREQVPYPGGGFDFRDTFTFQYGQLNRDCQPVNPTEVTFNGGRIQIPGLVYVNHDYVNQDVNSPRTGIASFYFVSPVNGN